MENKVENKVIKKTKKKIDINVLMLKAISNGKYRYGGNRISKSPNLISSQYIKRLIARLVINDAIENSETKYE